MDRLVNAFLFSLLLLCGSQAATAASFMVSNSAGSASVSNIDGYDRAVYLRLDGAFFMTPQLGVNIFIVDYDDFDYNEADAFYTATGHSTSLVLKGVGFGIIGRLPLNAHFQPYARAEYFDWDLEARALDRTVGKDSGGTVGIAVGAQIPVRKFFGFRGEVLRYEDISGADIEQFGLGLTFEF